MDKGRRKEAAEVPGRSPLDELVGDWTECLSRASDIRRYDIAGRGIQISSRNRSLAEKLFRSLSHLQAPDNGSPALDVLVLEGSQSRTDPYDIPGLTMRDSNDPVVVHGKGWRARFDPREGLLSVLDLIHRRALFWVADESRLPYWEEHAPLRHIFSWWLEGEDFRIVHAAGVGTPAGGALVVGAAGSGKSSTALSCLGSGLECSGDDYQLVHTSGELRAFSLYSCVKLELDNVARFPGLRGQGEMVEKKKRFWLNEVAPGEILRDFPIRAVLTPKVVAGTSNLVPISAGRALAALAPSSILQLHQVDSDPLAAMATIVSKANTFRLELGNDMDRVPLLVQKALG